MANFCGGGDFHSLPLENRNRSFSQDGTGMRREPQGVSQWGRQQLSDSSAPGSSSSTSSSRGRGGGGGGGGFHSENCPPSKVAIQDLSPHMANTSIVGTVVMKHSVHSFPDKRNPGSQRYKFTFTLRDTPVDYINVTCWGSEVNYITQLHRSFKISDIVEIVNGQILSKTGSDAEERWNSWTPSPYQVNVSETYSMLSLYSGPNSAELSSLVHTPLRPVRDCHALSSVITSGQSMDGTHISILAAVRHVGKPREMTSKSGKSLKKCEVKLMDRECSSFSLLIWDDELIELAQTWTPRDNILHAVDVKVTFDSYRNCVTAVCDQKTLIITNPDCSEAYQLYQFSQSVDIGPECSDFPSEADESTGSIQDNIESISEVYTIEELQERQLQGKGMSSVLWEAPSPSSQSQSFSGILFSYLTQLNITGDTKSVVCYRCSLCKFRVSGQGGCSNKNCPSYNPSSISTSLTASDLAQSGEVTEPHFNLLVSLSDSTGGLEGVWLGGQGAVQVLGCSPVEFLDKTEDQKAIIKKRLLLEKVKVYFKSFVGQSDHKKPLVKILSVSLADPREAAAHMKVM